MKLFVPLTILLTSKFQSPYCPPKPMPPPIVIQSSTYEENMMWIWQKRAHTDVIFIVGNKAFAAHKFILATASITFYNLFSSEDDITSFEIGRSSSESSLVRTKIFIYGGKTLEISFNLWDIIAFGQVYLLSLWKKLVKLCRTSDLDIRYK